MKTVIITLQLALLLASAQAEEKPSQDTDWASLNINLPALNAWGTKTYTYSAREPGEKETNVLGTVSLSTTLRDDAVILEDNFQITYEGEKLSLQMIHTCKKDNFLTPTRIESKGEGSDEFSTFVATVANGKATVRAQDGHQSVRDFPKGTITTAAMMRLVTLVPRMPGKTYSYEYSLESGEMNLKEKCRLEVLPPETITSGDRQVQCAKFKLTGGGINPVYYWVTEEGLLQRLMMDDQKIIELAATPKAE